MVAYTPAAPATSAISLSSNVGEDRDETWELTANGTIAGVHEAKIHARPTAVTTDAATIPSNASTFPRHPATSPAAQPMICVIRGATSMAPMTTAVQSR